MAAAVPGGAAAAAVPALGDAPAVPALPAPGIVRPAATQNKLFLLLALAVLAFFGWALGRFLDYAVHLGDVSKVSSTGNFAVLGVLLGLALGWAWLIGTNRAAEVAQRYARLTFVLIALAGLILSFISVLSDLPYSADRIMSGVAVVAGWLTLGRLLLEIVRVRNPQTNAPDLEWQSVPAVGCIAVVFVLIVSQTIIDRHADPELWSGFPGFAAYSMMIVLYLWLVFFKVDQGAVRDKFAAAIASAQRMTRALAGGGAAAPAPGAAAAEGAPGEAAAAGGAAGEAAAAEGAAGGGAAAPAPGAAAAGGAAGEAAAAGGAAGEAAAAGGAAGEAAAAGGAAGAPAGAADAARQVRIDTTALDRARKNLNWAYEYHLATLSPEQARALKAAYVLRDLDIKRNLRRATTLPNARGLIEEQLESLARVDRRNLPGTAEDFAERIGIVANTIKEDAQRRAQAEEPITPGIQTRSRVQVRPRFARGAEGSGAGMSFGASSSSRR